LEDNTFEAKGGAFNSYGQKAHMDLIVTRGKGFRKEKDKVLLNFCFCFDLLNDRKKEEVIEEGRLIFNPIQLNFLILIRIFPRFQ
jgi:hypothetical protein